MANNRNRVGTVYVQPGNPDLVNENVSATLLSIPYAPGEVGQDYPWNQKWYQIVKLDTNAGPTTPAGAVAANQLAYWVDKRNYIVTNNNVAAAGGATAAANQIAGRFGSAITPGNVCHVQQRGLASMLDGGNTFTAGQMVIAGTANNGSVTGAPAGAAPPSTPVGQAQGPSVAGIVTVYMNIPSAE